MGDRTTCTLVCGGKTTKAKMRALMRAIDTWNGSPCTGNELPDEGGICDFGEFEEVNYGALGKGVWHALRDAGLTFRWGWYAGGDYDRGYIYWRPGMDAPDDPSKLKHYWLTNDGHEFAEVRAMEAAAAAKPGLTVEAFVASLEIPPDVPPLEWRKRNEVDPSPPEPSMHPFTVIGVNDETGERFAEHTFGKDADDAESLVIKTNRPVENYTVAGVIAGHVELLA